MVQHFTSLSLMFAASMAPITYIPTDRDHRNPSLYYEIFTVAIETYSVTVSQSLLPTTSVGHAQVRSVLVSHSLCLAHMSHYVRLVREGG